jgi:uncharacterized protein GlcG (DUF336 family)
VVDQGGQLVAFERMDAADLVTIGLAQDKAWTALMNRMPTRDLAPLVQPGAEFYGYESIGRGRTIVFAGGMPLLRDGVLVGGVGVSGGSVEEDQRRSTPPSPRSAELGGSVRYRRSAWPSSPPSSS